MLPRRRGALVLLACAVVAVLLAACSSTAPEPHARPAPEPGPVTPSVPPELAPSVADGPTLHVAPDGDDDAAGTAEAPLRTIARAAELATPGTVVRVAPGRYEGSITTAASGTEGAPVTYLSDPVGEAEVVGTGETAAWHNLGDHVDVVGFTITGEALDGLLNEGSYVRLTSNRISGFEGNCLSTSRSGYTLHDIDVISNVVHDCGRSSLDHGIYVSHPGGTVANNIAFGNAGFGIHCWHNCNDLVVSNNLVFDNAEGGILIGQGDSPNDGEVDADNFIVSNNIAVDNEYYGIRESGATGSNNRYLNNAVSGNGEDGLQLRNGRETGTITTEPQFVDYQRNGSGDYRLLPSSPIVDAGTPEGAAQTDIIGTPRPLGDGVDIGVYEQ